MDLFPEGWVPVSGTSGGRAETAGRAMSLLVSARTADRIGESIGGSGGLGV